VIALVQNPQHPVAQASRFGGSCHEIACIFFMFQRNRILLSGLAPEIDGIHFARPTDSPLAGPSLCALPITSEKSFTLGQKPQ
jgi:hypothetical protein